MLFIDIYSHFYDEILFNQGSIKKKVKYSFLECLAVNMIYLE